MHAIAANVSASWRCRRVARVLGPASHHAAYPLASTRRPATNVTAPVGPCESVCAMGASNAIP